MACKRFEFSAGLTAPPLAAVDSLLSSEIMHMLRATVAHDHLHKRADNTGSRQGTDQPGGPRDRPQPCIPSLGCPLAAAMSPHDRRVGQRAIIGHQHKPGAKHQSCPRPVWMPVPEQTLPHRNQVKQQTGVHILTTASEPSDDAKHPRRTPHPMRKAATSRGIPHVLLQTGRLRRRALPCSKLSQQQPTHLEENLRPKILATGREQRPGNH
jgi:hypothetical protein